jgi:outer membrane protein assembly factor BamA
VDRNIIVDVTESPSVVVDYGLRYTTDRSFQVVADVVAPNLFGRAQRAGVRTLLGRDDRILRFTYSTPYFARFDLDTDFFLERAVKEENPRDDEDFRPFIDRSWTFTAQQARPLAQSLSLQWSYSFRRTVTEPSSATTGTTSSILHEGACSMSRFREHRASWVPT